MAHIPIELWFIRAFGVAKQCWMKYGIMVLWEMFCQSKRLLASSQECIFCLFFLGHTIWSVRSTVFNRYPSETSILVLCVYLQELSFVTSIQRFLDKPLSVRFHYGHPDLFDKWVRCVVYFCLLRLQCSSSFCANKLYPAVVVTVQWMSELLID